MLKTSVRLTDEHEIETLQAMCHLLGQRPHELAAWAVRDVMRRARQDPDVGPTLDEVISAARACRLERETPAPPALRVIQGGRAS